MSQPSVIQYIICFSIRPERLDAFVDLLEEVKATLPAVPGCRGVEVFRHLDEPLHFTLVEAWASREAHGLHVEGLAASGQWDAIASHFAAEPVGHHVAAL